MNELVQSFLRTLQAHQVPLVLPCFDSLYVPCQVHSTPEYCAEVCPDMHVLSGDQVKRGDKVYPWVNVTLEVDPRWPTRAFQADCEVEDGDCYRGGHLYRDVYCLPDVVWLSNARRLDQALKQTDWHTRFEVFFRAQPWVYEWPTPSP